METKQRFDSLSGDGLSPLIKVAPALMHAENLSMQSLARAGRGGARTLVRYIESSIVWMLDTG